MGRFALTLILLLGLQGVAFAAEGILPTDAPWGGSPSFRQPAWMPEPPALQGWRHFLGARFDVSMIVLDGKVLVGTNESLQLLDADNGEELWSKADYLGLGMAANRVCNGPLLFLGREQGILTLDLASGETMWGQNGFVPLGYCDAGLWATRPDAGAYSPAELGRDIYLLDVTSGEALQHFEIGELRGCARSKNRALPYMAACTAETGYILQPDGSRQSFAAPIPALPCRMAINSNGVFMHFYGRAELALKHREGLLPALKPEEYEGLWEALKDNKEHCAFYSILENKLSWEREIAWPDILEGEIPDWPQCNENFAAMGFAGRVLLLNTSDGSMFAELPQEQDEYDYLLRLDEADMFYSSFRMDDLPQRVYRLSLADGSITETGLRPQSIFTQAAAILDGRAIMLEESNRRSPFRENYWISGVLLDDSYSVVPGEMELLSEPYGYEDLGARFLTSPAPLQDHQLMLHISVEGTGAIAGLLKQTDPADAVRLDALAATAVYLERMRSDPGNVTSPLLQFVEILRDSQHVEQLVPHMIRWSEDGSVSELHWPLRGLLASLELPAAADYLSQNPAFGLNIEHEPQQHFYIIPTPGDGTDPQWSEVTAADGRRFAAYVSAGTLSSRDIYIALDADNNGILEQSFPSGLSDWSDFYIAEGQKEPGEALPIGLRLEGNSLYLKHHLPVLDTSFGYVRGTLSTESEIDLEQLTMDSDGDGVSDRLETLLLTDLQSQDSDADGIEDALDSTPNLNLASLGPLETGLARGLAYLFASSALAPAEQLPPVVEGHPHQICYFHSPASGPVAFGTQELQGVALTAVQAEKMKLLNGGNDLRGLAKVSFIDKRIVLEEDAASKDESRLAGERRLQWLLQLSWQPQQYATADLIMFVELGPLSFAVALREVKGELQPCAADTFR